LLWQMGDLGDRGLPRCLHGNKGYSKTSQGTVVSLSTSSDWWNGSGGIWPLLNSSGELLWSPSSACSVVVLVILRSTFVLYGSYLAQFVSFCLSLNCHLCPLGNTNEKLYGSFVNYFHSSVWVHLLSICVHFESMYTLYYVQERPKS
jgi:hypothetical protein